MKNRKWFLIASLVLALTMSLGGTLAYLTDTDADVNVMTLGKVHIVQNEQMRDVVGDLVAYQNQPILPAVYDSIEWDDETVTISGQEYNFFNPEMKNVIDKIVTVTNTGNTGAFVRTIIAIEAPEGFNDDLVHKNVNNTNGVVQTNWAYTTTAAGRYTYSVFTYTDALAAKATSQPSLLQIFLDKTADNEHIAALGDEWEIIALSQAVQAEGFADPAVALNEAFGEATAVNVAQWLADAKGDVGSPGDKWPNNNPPVEATEVETLAELKEIFAKGGYAKLKNNITLDNMIKLENGAEVTLDLNGKTIDFERNSEFKPGNPIFYPLAGTKLTITGNGTIDLGDNFDTALVYPAGEVIFENGTFIRNRVPAGTSTDDVQTLFVGVKSVGASVVIKDGYFDGGYYDPAVEAAFAETDADIANRGKAADKNAYRTAVKDNVSLLINLSWSSAAGTQDFRIYGGTFVGANPAWGDEGCAMPITPDYLRPWSYYQGMFLEGQVMHDDKIEIPDGYTITEGKTADGRPTYTVNYSK